MRSRPTDQNRGCRLACLVLGGAALALLGSTAAVAAGFSIGRAMSFRARFTTVHTARSSGLVLRTAGAPPAAGSNEAPAVRQTVILPVGSVLRLGRLPQCHATDAQIRVHAAERACPARTRVGSGGADGVLAGAKVHFDIGIYAVRAHLVFAAERAGQPLGQSFNAFASHRSLILTVPTLGGQIAPTGFNARIGARHAWLLTPASCPSSGHWTIIGRFQGVGAATSTAPAVTPAQRRTDRIPCRR